MKGGPFGEKIFSKKSHNAEKTDPLVSLGMVGYAEKKEKSFWFSSMGQQVQFASSQVFVELLG